MILFDFLILNIKKSLLLVHKRQGRARSNSSPFVVVLASFGNATEAINLGNFGSVEFTIFEATVMSFVKQSKNVTGTDAFIFFRLLICSILLLGLVIVSIVTTIVISVVATTATIATTTATVATIATIATVATVTAVVGWGIHDSGMSPDVMVVRSWVVLDNDDLVASWSATAR